MLAKKIKLQCHDDNIGQQIFAIVRGGVDIPFEIKRIYYIFGTPENVRRGFHAHKKLQQVLICVSGSCKIHLDNGNESAEVTLDSPDKGLYISSDIWREMYDFSKDAVLLCLASEHYDENDYIRNYNQFIQYIKEQK